MTTVKELARKLGRSPSAVTYQVHRLLSKDELIKHVKSGKLNITDAGAEKIAEYYEKVGRREHKSKGYDWMYSDSQVCKPNRTGIATHTFLTGRHSF